MSPFYPLNFGPLDLIWSNYEFKPPRPRIVKNQIAYDNQVDAPSAEILTPEFHKLLTWDLALPLRRVIVFAYSNRSQNNNVHPHIDGDGSPNLAINMTFGQSKHMIEWFHPKTPNAGTQRTTDFGEQVRIFQEEELELVTRTDRKKPMVFNTAIPHRARMTMGSEEWTVSIRFDFQYITEEDFMDRLEPFMEEQ